MIHPLALVAYVLASAFVCQTQEPVRTEPAWRVTTRLVLVDVVVEDGKGRPVQDLRPGEISVFEDGRPVKTAFVTLETLGPARAVPSLPPHVHTNRPEYRSSPGPATILLLDGLNTPMQDQANARVQLLKYVSTQLKPGQPVAVFALGNSLRLLQDFTEDASLLQSAMASLRPMFSRELSMEDSGQQIPPSRESRLATVTQGLREFYTQHAIFARERRVAVTLAALRTIARSVATLPGRKNLVWVSASFPLTSFETRASFANEVRLTTMLLTDARIAMYPVDARGLVGPSIADASRPGVDPRSGYLLVGAAYGDAILKEAEKMSGPLQTMDELATLTGGRVFANRNDIDNAVAASVREGESYYVTGYYPENKIWNGKFRRLRVTVARPGVKVRHRRGYYAIDPAVWNKGAKAAHADLAAALATGAAPATSVLFDARFAPASGPPTSKLLIDFLVGPATLSPQTVGDGSRRYQVDFHVVAVKSDGSVAARRDLRSGRIVKKADLEVLEQQGVPFSTELDLAPGTYQIRLAVQDTATGLFGTLTAPVTLSESK